MAIRLVGSARAAACADSSFQDCAIACTDASGCPDRLSCGREGYCRIEGASGSCMDVLAACDDTGHRERGVGEVVRAGEDCADQVEPGTVKR